MLGGAIGSAARFWLSTLITERVSDLLPWGTLAVNVIGSFVIGLVYALSSPGSPVFIQAEVRTFIMIGLLGGFTTFSSFSLQTLTLMQSGEWLYASLNVFVSVMGCLVAVFLGALAGNWWVSRI